MARADADADKCYLLRNTILPSSKKKTTAVTAWWSRIDINVLLFCILRTANERHQITRPSHQIKSVDSRLADFFLLLSECKHTVLWMAERLFNQGISDCERRHAAPVRLTGSDHCILLNERIISASNMETVAAHARTYMAAIDWVEARAGTHINIPAPYTLQYMCRWMALSRATHACNRSHVCDLPARDANQFGQCCCECGHVSECVHEWQCWR